MIENSYLYGATIYLIIGAFLVLGYIGSAGYPHKFSWKSLIKRMFERENLPFALGLIVMWLPAIIYMFLRNMWDRMKERK